MPRKQRMFRHGETYFVSNRTARGLPFVPNTFMNIIIGGILARATNICPGVAVSDWLFMGNHYHAIVTLVGCAKDFRYFMNYIDGEIGKVINRLLGVTNQNVWAGEFEARPLLTAEAVINKTVYLYCNPTNANLVDSISDFPGISTWDQLQGNSPLEFKRIKPSELHQLPRTGFSKSLLRELLKEIEIIERKPSLFLVEPFVWIKYLHDAKHLTKEQVAARVKREVAKEEELRRTDRRRRQKGIIGVEALTSQSFYKHYRPSSWRKSTACISTCGELAKQYLKLYRDFCARCNETWQEWKEGNINAKYPPGAFLPPQNPFSSIWV